MSKKYEGLSLRDMFYVLLVIMGVNLFFAERTESRLETLISSQRTICLSLWDKYPNEEIANFAGGSEEYDDACAVLNELARSVPKEVSSQVEPKDDYLQTDAVVLANDDIDCGFYDPEGLDKWLADVRAHKAGEVKSVNSTNLSNYLSGDPDSCPGK